jgi:hypothetical protein
MPLRLSTSFLKLEFEEFHLSLHMMLFLGFLTLVFFCNSFTIFSQRYKQGPYVLLDPIFV